MAFVLCNIIRSVKIEKEEDEWLLVALVRGVEGLGASACGGSGGDSNA